VSGIQIFFEDIPSLKINKTLLKNYIKSLIFNELKDVGEISLVFCSDDYLLNINKQYLNHNYYTDIVTFDYGENSVISGDLFISVDRVKENAGIFSTAIQRELFRVVFHGVLHLIGYNDKTDEERNEMRGKEDYYLSEVDFEGIEL
jgi:probable rRNA maturation factor